jgi:anaerobic magnesium-protoporphyrin IX monomethyl ester cyclase
MRTALVNPRWSFEGSISFGCRDPHLPLEHGYTKALLGARSRGAAARCSFLDLGFDEVRAELRALRPDMTVLTTATTYLFWRCPLPELRGAQQLAAAVRNEAGVLVAVGPHASATPGPILDKLGADVAVMGECEEVLTHLADGEKDDLPGIAYRDGNGIRINGGPQAAAIVDGSSARRPNLGRRSRHRRAALTTARSAPRNCFGTAIGGAISTRSSSRSTASSSRVWNTSITSTRSSCPTGRCSKPWPDARWRSACRPGSICGSRQ